MSHVFRYRYVTYFITKRGEIVARPGVDYDDVRAFMDEFAAARGQPPSIKAIIAECGGSATTIARFKRRYLEEVEGVPAGAHAVPDALEGRIAAGARALWAECLEALEARERELEGRVDRQLEAGESRIAAARSAEREAALRAELTDKHLTETQATLVTAREELADVKAAHQGCQSALTLARDELAEQAKKFAAIDAERNAKVRALEDALTSSEERLSEARAERKRSETAYEKRLAAQQRDHAEALSALKARAEDLDATHHHLTEQLERLKNALDTETEARARAEIARDERAERLADCQKRLQTTEQMINRLEHALGEARDDHGQCRTELTDLERRVAENQARRAAELNAARERITEKAERIVEQADVITTLRAALDTLKAPRDGGK